MKFAYGWRIVRLGARGREFVLREISWCRTIAKEIGRALEMEMRRVFSQFLNLSYRVWHRGERGHVSESSIRRIPVLRKISWCWCIARCRERR